MELRKKQEIDFRESLYQEIDKIQKVFVFQCKFRFILPIQYPRQQQQSIPLILQEVSQQQQKTSLKQNLTLTQQTQSHMLQNRAQKQIYQLSIDLSYTQIMFAVIKHRWLELIKKIILNSLFNYRIHIQVCKFKLDQCGYIIKNGDLKYLIRCIFFELFQKFSYSLCHSELQLLIGDSHMSFYNQQNDELYYKLSLLFVESQNTKKVLKCFKFSYDLEYNSRKEFQKIILLKDNNRSNSNNNSNTGLLDYFGLAVNAAKHIQKSFQQQQAKYQPQPQNFYNEKKFYLINDDPQNSFSRRAIKKEVAPPSPRKKINHPKPIFYKEYQHNKYKKQLKILLRSQQQANQSEHIRIIY
ncbi:unnamed protein product [Paramecium pentaurelia]|uniref:Uncharacterized protein n=1 Tax=Paramecium pentaurelia TaxID=43138 RepID=A0A8S1U6S3_9CILI|nr:unnamed protein product [Paramecium pentaurelia]